MAPFDHNMASQNFFYSSLCHWCKKIDNNLKRCASCKTVAYCSREHQVADWCTHKDLCKVINKCSSLKNFKSVKSCQDLQALKIKQSVLWQTELERPLEPYESQMWMFPRICTVCYTTSNIENCEICLNEFYCSQEHKNQHLKYHRKYCAALKLAMLIDIHYFNRGRENPILLKGLPSDMQLVENKTSFINAVCEKDISWRDDVQYVIDTDHLLSAATLLLALEKSQLLINRNLEKNDFEIHFVGASNFELCLNWFSILEVLFHYIMNLSKITIMLVGPELNGNENVDFMQFKQALCTKCQHKVQRMVFRTFQDLYHKKIMSLKKPSIVVAFNSGLHEFKGDTLHDSWQQSIQSLTNYTHVPLLLTAYTEQEINEDLNRIKEVVEVDVICPPQENPFHNQRPFRNWASSDVPVFYNNGFMAVVTRKEAIKN